MRSAGDLLCGLSNELERWRRFLFHGFGVMGVVLECGGEIIMPHDALNLCQRDVLLEQQTAVIVANIVRRDLRILAQREPDKAGPATVELCFAQILQNRRRNRHVFLR